MYAEMSGEEDRKKVESWKGDADGILIFVRLTVSHTDWSADSNIIYHRLVYSPRPSPP